MSILCIRAPLYVINCELDSENVFSGPNSDEKVAEIRATTTACPVSTPHTLGHRISILPEDPLSLITAYLDTESRRAARAPLSVFVILR